MSSVLVDMRRGDRLVLLLAFAAAAPALALSYHWTRSSGLRAVYGDFHGPAPIARKTDETVMVPPLPSIDHDPLSRFMAHEHFPSIGFTDGPPADDSAATPWKHQVFK